MTPEDHPHLAADFTALANKIRATGNAANIPLILAALDLAPTALAAIAYHDRQGERFGPGCCDAWEALERAVTVYKETLR